MRVYLVVVILLVILTLYALIDAIFTPRSLVRGVSKSIWILLIVILPVIGSVLWFVVGKPRRFNGRVIGPDDDPEFLGGIK